PPSRKTNGMTARARTLAVFGAYLCLATHLMGVLHVLVVRHATCPGHGELVHGVAPAVDHTPPPAGKSARAAVEAGEELDEHCLLLATRRRELAGLTPAATSIVHTPRAAAPGAQDLPARRRRLSKRTVTVGVRPHRG